MSCRRWFTLTSIAGLLVSFCLAQTPTGPRTRTAPARSGPPYMQQIKSFDESQSVSRIVLKNGLTVLVNEYRILPLAAIVTYIKAGYLNEPDDATGVSHVLERMFYKGTPTRGAGVIAKEIRALGGKITSSTGYDHTVFQTAVPSAQWKKALEMQADSVLNPLIDGEELKRETELIRHEASQNENNRAYEQLLNLGFTEHRIRRSRMEDGLQRLTRESVLQYHRMSYSPARMILVVSGDVNTAEVLSEVVRVYGSAKGSSEKPSASSREPEQTSFRYREIRGPIQMAQLLFGFHTAPMTSEDYPALQVLTAVLGLGEQSVLMGRLAEQKKIILRGSADLLALSQVGYLALRVEADPKDIDRSEIALLTELEILRRTEPSPADLERAVALREREHWSDLQTVQGKASKLAFLEAAQGWKGTEDDVTRLRKVKPADVSRVARKYLGLEKCSLVEYLPGNAEPRNLSTEVLQNTFQELLQPSVQEALAEREKATVLALKIPETHSPFKYSEVRFPMQKASVLRGPELFIREDHTAPTIDMAFFFLGGKLFENQQNAGITNLMLKSMLKGGTKEVPAERFYQQLEIFGGRIVPVVHDDYFGIFFSVLSGNVEQALDLVIELIKNPRFEPEHVARQKVIERARLPRQGEVSFAYSYRLLEQALFGDFPYALNTTGTEASLSSLTPEALQAWYKNTVQDRKPIVVIIGDTQGTSLARYFVRNFSGSRYQDVKLAENFPKPLQKPERITAQSDTSQSIVMLGFQAPPDGDDDAFPLTVLEDYASGAGGRLVEQIKDRQGLAYDVGLAYFSRLRGGMVAVYAASKADNAETVLKELEKEIQRLVETPVSYRDYRSAINSSVGNYWTSQQSRSAQISAVVRYILNGKGVEEVNQHVARLQSVNHEELQEIARRVFKMDKSVTVQLSGKPKKPAGTGAQN